MKVRHSKNPLPRFFADYSVGTNIIAEGDIKVTDRGRLRAKILVFGNKTQLQQFWKKAIGTPVGRKCQGCVNALSYEVIDFAGDKESAHIVVDPRYFCIIGLNKNNLNMEVIAHESGHAGYAYAKRHSKDFWLPAGSFDEENFCYPTGRIADSINRFLHDKDLYN